MISENINKRNLKLSINFDKIFGFSTQIGYTIEKGDKNMSLRVKLTSTIIAFVLLASMLIVGVFAVKQTEFSVGGSIVFDAKGIEAKIEYVDGSFTNGTFTDGKVPGTDVMQPVDLDSGMSNSDVATAFASWSGLNLAFNEAGDDVTFQIKISNLAETTEDNYIDVTALVDKGAAKNATITALNADTTKGVTALVYPGESETFNITLSVVDKEVNANMNGFKINFNLEKLMKADLKTDAEIRDEGNLTFNCVVASRYAMVGINTSATTAIVPRYIVSSTDTSVICATTYFGGSPAPINSLTKIYIPSTVKNFMGLRAPNLSEIIVENGLYDSRDNCNAVIETATNKIVLACNNTIIPLTVTAVDMIAFTYSKIENINIHAQVTSITSGSISYYGSVTNLTVAPENPIYDSRDNCSAIIETATNTLIAGCQNTVIPLTVTSIGNSAFAGCATLTSIKIPENIKTIGNFAFGNTTDTQCANLKTVTIDSQAVVTALTSNTGAGNLIYKATTINVRADLTPSTYLAGLTSGGTTVIDGVTYNVYTK